jgi:ADP-ribosyl-[dinitrogen reductase] hydrolase
MDLQDRASLALHDRLRGALLALACGDALGAPAEFKSRVEVQRRWGRLTEMVGGGVWAPGEWTDDASLALFRAIYSM